LGCERLVVHGELSDPDSNAARLVLDGEDEWQFELDGGSVRGLERGEHSVGRNVPRADENNARCYGPPLNGQAAKVLVVGHDNTMVGGGSREDCVIGSAGQAQIGNG